MKKYHKILGVILLIFVTIFSAGCDTLEIFSTDRKYGEIKLTPKNVVDFISGPSLESAEYDSSSGCFIIEIGYAVSGKVTKIQKDIIIKSSLDIKVIFEDQYGNRQTKKWEDMKVLAEIKASGESSAFVGGSSFRIVTYFLNLSYARVSKFIGATIEGSYLEDIEGQIYVPRPPAQEGSSENS